MISFPRVAGYRLELPDEPLYEVFSERSRLTLTTDIPTETEVGGLIGISQMHTLAKYQAMRAQEVSYGLADKVLGLFDTNRDPRPWYFPQILAIAKRWMSECVTYEPGTFPGLLLMAQYADDATRRILHSLTWQKGNRHPTVVPLFRQGDRTGSTFGVDFVTTKEVFPTGEKCHVNYVVLDGIGGNLWEKAVAEILESMSPVAAYVKNDRLGFTVPYALAGRSHEYIPDFIVRLKPRDEDDPVRTLMVEVSGTLKKAEPTKEKADTTRGLWVPAINAHGGFGCWGYAELTNPKTFRADLVTAIEAVYTDPSEFAREGVEL